MTEVVHRHTLPADDVLVRRVALHIYPDAEIVGFATKPTSERLDAANGRMRYVRTVADIHEFHLWERHRTDTVRPAAVPVRRFYVVPTGQKYEGTHRGMCIADNGTIWHLIEEVVA